MKWIVLENWFEIGNKEESGVSGLVNREEREPSDKDTGWFQGVRH